MTKDNFMINSVLLNQVILLFMILNACFAENRDVYLVLLEGEPVAFHQSSTPLEDGKRRDFTGEEFKAYEKHLVDTHNDFLQSNLEAGSYKKLYSFKHIVNGFAVHTTSSQIAKVKNAPGVRLMEKDKRVKLMTTHTPEFIGLPSVWAQEGGKEHAGEGIVIGIIDTGINPTHPSFAYDIRNPFNSKVSHFSGNCEGGPLFHETSCNGKIVSARFFSAGAQVSGGFNSSYDILSPFDAVGHGSHVASIAAGNFEIPVVVEGFFYGRASGMAPRARIAVYKAIYPSIGTLSDVLAAIDQAVLDGVDIITLAIGPDEPPEDTVTFLGMFEIFMLAARKAGTFVVQAVGNQGPGPYSVVSYSPWVVGAAASTTDRRYPGTLTLGNGSKIGGVGLSGPSIGQGVLKYRLVLAKDAIVVDGAFPRTPEYVEECQFPEVFDPAVVFGSVVLCSFSRGFNNGTSSLTAIIDTAKTLGFMGFVLLANPDYGDFIAEPIPFSVPGIMIPRTRDAKVILEYYEAQTRRDESGTVIEYGGRASISEGRTGLYVERAPIVSRFSSRGPDYIDQNRNPTDVLKPDILAPGYQIWGAWSPMSALNPMFSGYNFALISGTSMATPHIAGIAALIKQKNPSWTPSMIASAMSTSATKHDNHGDTIMAQGSDLDTIYTAAPFGFGSGLVNPERAMDPGLVFSAGYEEYISFLCTLPNMDPTRIHTATGGSCTSTFTNPSDLNVPSVTITALSGSRVVLRNVKNVGGKPETYSCAVVQPTGVAVAVEPSWFRIKPQGNQDLVIKLNVSRVVDDFSFGEIVLTGSLNHIVRIPLSILPVSVK